VERVIAEEVARVHQLIISNLAYVGEYAIGLARNHGNYKDWTGNLRASVGYIVSKDGKQVVSGGFDASAAPNGSEGDAGAREGRAFAESHVAKIRGIGLVVVAGMYYGAYVEKRQYDVLTFTEANARITAENLFRSMFGQGL
jgi:hypothetical protein